MITTLAGIYAAAASGLGGYNLVRFLAIRGIKKRRERKKDRARERDVKAAVDFARAGYQKLKAGDVDPEKIQDLIALVRQAK